MANKWSNRFNLLTIFGRAGSELMRIAFKSSAMRRGAAASERLISNFRLSVDLDRLLPMPIGYGALV